MSAHDAGLSKTEYKLPMNFKQIDNNVSNKELQISIYFNVVSELERKGYTCRIKFMEKYSIIIVSWTIKAPLSELEEMQAKILSLSL